MRDDDTTGLSEYSLRQRAEEIAQECECSGDTLSEANMRALCHELEVHQVELEMQNEYLQRAQAELAASESQLPRPKGRGLRLRKKSCRFWLVDRTAYYDQIY